MNVSKPAATGIANRHGTRMATNAGNTGHNQHFSSVHLRTERSSVDPKRLQPTDFSLHCT
jgi:hypothetical protein